MATNDQPTDEPTDDHLDAASDEPATHELEWPPEFPFGDADVRIDIDEETYQRAHEEYLRAVDHGYTDGFDTFVFNNCATDCYVTVEGERVEPGTDE